MKHFIPATLMADFYKLSHRRQYPVRTEVVYSTWTPRMSRIDDVNSVVCFGIQSFIKKYLIEYFNDNFFNRNKEDCISEYKRIVMFTLGDKNPETKHLEELHDLKYLPIQIDSLDEGTLVPIRVPMLVIYNTNPKFFWLTNYLETLMSSELWLPITSATIAKQYRKILNDYAMETVGNIDFVQFQGHDFSMRGMSGLESSMLSGAGHLLSFCGTDTIPAILFHEHYYNANVEKELVGTSVPASEHSVCSAYGENNEYEYYRRLITEVHPTGIVSLVSDTYNLWEAITKIIVPLKETILARDGKITIRPDSGIPEDIICGDINGKTEAERKGVIELLWDIFGGKLNDKGFKELDSHIGCIYGDAITLERCKIICERLKLKGFASTNMVYGIGSFTYQYNTRDTFGFALKSTYCEIDGKPIQIFKNPITDSGMKKSAKGCVKVIKSLDNKLELLDNFILSDPNLNKFNMLKPTFKNGILLKETSLADIRERLKNA